jgi:hypothetical protein
MAASYSCARWKLTFKITLARIIPALVWNFFVRIAAARIILASGGI